MKIKTMKEKFVIFKKYDKLNLDDKIFCLIQEYDGISVIKIIEDDQQRFGNIFKAFYIDELYDFQSSGILYSILSPLKENNISILVVSAFSRDYIFIPEEKYDEALKLL